MRESSSGEQASGAGSELLTDLYELTMAEAYLREGLHDQAVFSLFVRKLPRGRNALVVCGLEPALEAIAGMHFSSASLAYLRGLRLFSDALLSWLSRFRFSGEVWAMPEGTLAFPGEPLLQVIGPLPEAQLLETLVLNHLHLETVIASKARRIVAAAQGRPVVDFGLRRTHGLVTGLDVARAGFIAGVSATSNVLAGERFGIPVSGTIAHSYVQAHPSELDAFRAFARVYPEGTLLVDTYDTLTGIQNVIRLARELGDAFRIRAVRLDSGDLAELAVQGRRMLDAAGLRRVQIVASGGLDEHAIARIVESGAPIDGFGVGTSMDASTDAPTLDIAYKLVESGGKPRMKLSSGKSFHPGRQQVWRQLRDGEALGDRVGRFNERLSGEPLLECVLRRGERVQAGSLIAARDRMAAQWAKLPERLRHLEDAEKPYPVEFTPALEHRRAALEAHLREALR